MYVPTRKVLGWVTDFEGALNVTTVIQHIPTPDTGILLSMFQQVATLEELKQGLVED
jgi:hypothetical protein